MKRICLNHSVLQFCESVLTPDSFVLEFGSGWSTRWFAERCSRLLSVETSKEWFDKVTDDLADADCDWDIVLANPSEVQIDGEPDLVLVDCREDLRLQATGIGWSALASGGWLIFDDAQRERHKDAIDLLRSVAKPMSLFWDQKHDVPEARERVAMAFQK